MYSYCSWAQRSSVWKLFWTRFHCLSFLLHPLWRNGLINLRRWRYRLRWLCSLISLISYITSRCKPILVPTWSGTNWTDGKINTCESNYELLGNHHLYKNNVFNKVSINQLYNRFVLSAIFDQHINKYIGRYLTIRMAKLVRWSHWHVTEELSCSRIWQPSVDQSEREKL